MFGARPHLLARAGPDRPAEPRRGVVLRAVGDARAGLEHPAATRGDPQRVDFRGVREVGVDGTADLRAPRAGPGLAARRGRRRARSSRRATAARSGTRGRAKLVRRVCRAVPARRSAARPRRVVRERLHGCPLHRAAECVRGPFAAAYAGRVLAGRAAARRRDRAAGVSWSSRARTVALHPRRPHRRDYPALTWASSGWLFYGRGRRHSSAPGGPGEPARTARRARRRRSWRHAAD